MDVNELQLYSPMIMEALVLWNHMSGTKIPRIDFYLSRCVIRGVNLSTSLCTSGTDHSRVLPVKGSPGVDDPYVWVRGAS